MKGDTISIENSVGLALLACLIITLIIGLTTQDIAFALTGGLAVGIFTFGFVYVILNLMLFPSNSKDETQGANKT